MKLSFDYEGDFEIEDPDFRTIKVNQEYIIKFNSNKDYNYTKKKFMEV